jgi:hypothetical protein
MKKKLWMVYKMSKEEGRKKTRLLKRKCEIWLFYLTSIAHVLLNTVLVLLAPVLPKSLLGSYSDPLTKWSGRVHDDESHGRK